MKRTLPDFTRSLSVCNDAFDRRQRIELMNLQQIDVFGLKTRQRALHTSNEM